MLIIFFSLANKIKMSSDEYYTADEEDNYEEVDEIREAFNDISMSTQSSLSTSDFTGV